MVASSHYIDPMASRPAQFYQQHQQQPNQSQPPVAASHGYAASSTRSSVSSMQLGFSPGPPGARALAGGNGVGTPSAAAPMMPPGSASGFHPGGLSYAGHQNGLGLSPARPLSSASQHNVNGTMMGSPAQSSIALGSSSRAPTPSQLQLQQQQYGPAMQQQLSQQSHLSQHSQPNQQGTMATGNSLHQTSSAAQAAANAAASFSFGHRHQQSLNNATGGITSFLTGSNLQQQQLQQQQQQGYIGPRMSQAMLMRGSPTPSMANMITVGQVHSARVGGTPLPQNPTAPIYRSELDRVKAEKVQASQEAASTTMKAAERAIREGAPLYQPGAAILRVLQYSEAMSAGPQLLTPDYWRTFVDEFYTPEGVFRITLYNPVNGEQKPFEVPNSVLPRFMMNSYASGLRSCQLSLENPREYAKPLDGDASKQWYPLPPQSPPKLRFATMLPSASVTHVVEASRAMWMSTFENGWQVQMIGMMRLSMVPHSRLVIKEMPGIKPKLMMETQLRLESMDYVVSAHTSFIPRFAIVRTRVEQAIPQSALDAILASHGKTSDQKAKEEEMKTESADLPKISVEKLQLPECPVNEYGLTLRSMRCLEICESVCQLRDLMDYSLQEGIGPIEAIQQFASQSHQAQALQEPKAPPRRLLNGTQASANGPSQRVNNNSSEGSPRGGVGGSTTGSNAGSPAAGAAPGRAAAGAKRKGTADSADFQSPRFNAAESPVSKRLRVGD